jgi:sugar phosphate isomerase/epimerase
MNPLTRRSFIAASVATSACAALPSWAADASRKVEPIGLQLYTAREAMKSDFAGTLAKVASSGYREVEFAGYFDHSPADVRKLLSANSLTSPSMHVDYPTVENKWPETLDVAHALGQSYVICPWIEESQRKSPDGWKRAADLFNRAGEASQKAGIQFGYHNHTFEFEPAESLGGKLPYDFLLANTDPKLVAFEMDLCWITVAGKDPLPYFAQYPGRFPLVHVKDWKGQGGKMSEAPQKMANVGAGSIDWKRIFAQSQQAGIKHYIVENDEAHSNFDGIRASYQYLNTFRY